MHTRYAHPICTPDTTSCTCTRSTHGSIEHLDERISECNGVQGRTAHALGVAGGRMDALLERVQLTEDHANDTTTKLRALTEASEACLNFVHNIMGQVHFYTYTYTCLADLHNPFISNSYYERRGDQ